MLTYDNINKYLYNININKGYNNAQGCWNNAMKNAMQNQS